MRPSSLRPKSRSAASPPRCPRRAERRAQPSRARAWAGSGRREPPRPPIRRCRGRSARSRPRARGEEDRRAGRRSGRMSVGGFDGASHGTAGSSRLRWDHGGGLASGLSGAAAGAAERQPGDYSPGAAGVNEIGAKKTRKLLAEGCWIPECLWDSRAQNRDSRAQPGAGGGRGGRTMGAIQGAGCALGLDYGSRRIGLAVSDEEGLFAFPAGALGPASRARSGTWRRSPR